MGSKVVGSKAVGSKAVELVCSMAVGSMAVGSTVAGSKAVGSIQALDSIQACKAVGSMDRGRSSSLLALQQLCTRRPLMLKFLIVS